MQTASFLLFLVLGDLLFRSEANAKKSQLTRQQTVLDFGFRHLFTWEWKKHHMWEGSNTESDYFQSHQINI